MKLILESEGLPGGVMEISPAGLPLILGRSHRADITISDGQLSRLHAELRYRQSVGFEIADLDSTNLTIVNEQDVSTHPLVSGDVILLGDTEISVTVESPAGDPSEKTTRDLPILPLGDESTTP